MIATLLVPMAVGRHASSAQEARLLPLGAGLLWLGEAAGFTRQGGELGDRTYAELGGNGAAMQLDGALVDAERRGDLLIHAPLHHFSEHLRFAFGERREADFELLASVARCARVGI